MEKRRQKKKKKDKDGNEIEIKVYYPQIDVIFDKFYNTFSGFKLDHCFANYALNKHHKTEEFKDLISDLDRTKFMKLMLNSRKPKEILSINKKSKVIIENFFNHLPLSATVEKEEYEHNCQGVLNHLRENLKDFKEELTKIENLPEIDLIQLIGGVTRVPSVKSVISEVFSQ
jgi:molecular chaperone DnaK (HSP70)